MEWLVRISLEWIYEQNVVGLRPVMDNARRPDEPSALGNSGRLYRIRRIFSSVDRGMRVSSLIASPHYSGDLRPMLLYYILRIVENRFCKLSTL
jgi:hypothetical protein